MCLTHSVDEVLVVSLLVAVHRLLLPGDERMERRGQIGGDERKRLRGVKDGAGRCHFVLSAFLRVENKALTPLGSGGGARVFKLMCVFMGC